MQRNDIEQNTVFWQEYEQSCAYLANKGFKKNLPIYTDLMENRHWPSTTEKTKNLPRPVINVTKMVIDNKAGNIAGTPVKLNFRADSDRQATDKFTKFADYQQKEMEQAYWDDKAIYNGLVLGTYIYHYYWDEESIGKQGNYAGGLSCQVIHPLNCHFADPTEEDVQKQRWVMFDVREDISKVRDMCDKKSKRALIYPDDIEDTTSTQLESETSKRVTVLIKYFRIDGEVYFQKATKTVVLHEPKPLNPLIIYEKLKKSSIKAREAVEFDGESPDVIVTDGAISSLPDSFLTKENNMGAKRYKASLYPIEVGSLEPREKCIYGISTVDGIKEVQKSINFLHALTILNAQLLGSPKYVAKKGALNGQQITNNFGEVLTDHSAPGTQGFYVLKAEPFSAAGMQLAPNLIDQIRMATNASEVITGDMVGKDMSGTAIAQLQAQSQKPIAKLQKRFWRSKERIGKILEQFYKLYYEKKEFSYTLNPREVAMYKEIEEIRMKEQNDYIPQEIFDTQQDTFMGEEYRDTSFSIVVEAGAGTQYSEIQAMNMLNNLLNGGFIDVESFIKWLPNSAIPFKAEMMDYLSLRKQEENQVLKGQVEQLEQQLQQLSGYIKQQEGSIRELTRANEKAINVNKSLHAEYSNKIKTAKELISIKREEPNSL